ASLVSGMLKAGLVTNGSALAEEIVCIAVMVAPPWVIWNIDFYDAADESKDTPDLQVKREITRKLTYRNQRQRPSFYIPEESHPLLRAVGMGMDPLRILQELHAVFAQA